MINDISKTQSTLVCGGVAISSMLEKLYSPLVSMLYNAAYIDDDSNPINGVPETWMHQMSLAFTTSFALTGTVLVLGSKLIKHAVSKNTSTTCDELKERQQRLDILERTL